MEAEIEARRRRRRKRNILRSSFKTTRNTGKEIMSGNLEANNNMLRTEF